MYKEKEIKREHEFWSVLVVFYSNLLAAELLEKPRFVIITIITIYDSYFCLFSLATLSLVGTTIKY